MHPAEADQHIGPGMSKKLKSTALVERRSSRRLAEKRRIGIISPEGNISTKTAENETDPGEADESKNKSDSKSKSFLDCLELQPVELDSGSELANTENSYVVNIKAKDSIDEKSENAGPQTLPPTSRKCKGETKKRVKHSKRSQNVDLTEDIENNHRLKSGSEKQQEKMLKGSERSSDFKMRLLKSVNHDADTYTVDCVTADAKHAEPEKNGNRINPVYIFRDVNKVAHSMCAEDSTADLFLTVDLNSHGKKRRYDKLIKKLVDSEKKLEVNLREVKHNDLTNEADINRCVEKMKEKLRIREKKKYEYLINYMRDQWKVDQKSFQDLLPQKVDIVKENVVRQLGANTDKVVSEKRKRGRPRKDSNFTVNVSDSSEEMPQVKHCEQKRCRKQRYSANFPLKHVSRSNVSLSQNKVDKFRIGIVDKDGGQEIIELNRETLQGVNSFNITDNTSITATSEKQEIITNDQISQTAENIDNTNMR